MAKNRLSEENRLNVLSGIAIRAQKYGSLEARYAAKAKPADLKKLNIRFKKDVAQSRIQKFLNTSYGLT